MKELNVKKLDPCEELNSPQPINTAPADGTEILLYVPYCYGWEMGRWSKSNNAWSCLPYKPTHWMKLPEPPK